MADSTYGNIFDVAVAGAGLTSAEQRAAAPNNVFGGARPPRRWGAASAAAPRRDAHMHAQTAEPPPLPLNVGAYRVALLLGPVNMTAALKAQLVDFARSGGHVVVAAGVVGPQDGDLTGIPTLTPQLRAGRAWRWTAGGGAPGTQVSEPFRFVPASVPAGSLNVTVLAVTAAALDVCGGAPCALATRYALGDGAVTTCLVPWFEGGEGLAGVAQALLHDAVSAAAPLQVAWDDGAGWPVDTVAAKGPGSGGYTVVVTNNEGASWRGAVTVTASAPGAPATLSACVELRTGAPVALNGRTLSLSVGAYDAAVVRCSATW